MPHSSHLKTQTLLLGGARSGKSSYAEKQAVESELERIYIATAKVLDNEMEQRVSRHKKDRASHQWITIEEPLALAECLQQWASPERVIVVDCLTMWMTNLLSEEPDTLKKEVDALINSLKILTGEIIFVSNEVSMGIIPMGELTRLFVDEIGRLHQQIAQEVDNVTLMVAGLPHKIKSTKKLDE